MPPITTMPMLANQLLFAKDCLNRAPYPRTAVLQTGQRRAPSSRDVTTGQTKAVFIGINYTGSSSELHGCINDAHNIRNALKATFGFPADDSNVMMLTDEAVNTGTSLFPTKANLKNALNWLVSGAKAGDSLFLHYSGHGGIEKDVNGVQPDGFDQLIYPVDFTTSGTILDEELHQILINPLATGVKLTALFDSCHSGTVLDLSYYYDIRVSADPTIAYTDKGITKVASRGSCLPSVFKQSTPAPPLRVKSGATVVLFSACKDAELSYDVSNSGTLNFSTTFKFLDGNFGLMSSIFVKCIQSVPNQTYYQLLRSIDAAVTPQYAMSPVFSTNTPIDLNSNFSVFV